MWGTQRERKSDEGWGGGKRCHPCVILRERDDLEEEAKWV